MISSRYQNLKIKKLEREETNMATCTAPVNGHRTESGRANCPVCGRNNGYQRYRSYSTYSSGYSSSGLSSGTNANRTKKKASWSSRGVSDFIYICRDKNAYACS